jgi:hypothetical protein
MVTVSTYDQGVEKRQYNYENDKLIKIEGENINDEVINEFKLSYNKDDIVGILYTRENTKMEVKDIVYGQTEVAYKHSTFSKGGTISDYEGIIPYDKFPYGLFGLFENDKKFIYIYAHSIILKSRNEFSEKYLMLNDFYSLKDNSITIVKDKYYKAGECIGRIEKTIKGNTYLYKIFYYSFSKNIPFYIIDITYEEGKSNSDLHIE